MPANPPSPMLLALRESTRDCHKALEARLPFFSPRFDEAAYRRLLQAYYGFHAPLEHLLGVYQEPERRKAHILARDLRALGLSDADIDALPLCQALPSAADEACVLGVMYVVEGSTLGGQVLKRAMAERLGIGQEGGGAFLDVYGELTGSYWRSFLDRLGKASGAQATTVQAAIDTFGCFQAWLEQRNVLNECSGGQPEGQA